jgi:BMFP domain-containing protein YqiC
MKNPGDASPMNFLQLIGILVIVNSLIWALWRHSQEGGLGVGGGALLAFALVAGLALIFYKREVEVSFTNEGASIKAAAEQATADAAEIAAIRKRVEAQAATLDLVAKESADAKQLVDNLRQESERADKKLKMLEAKTSQIKQLPDGRVKTGGTVTGDFTILAKHFNDMQVAYREMRLEDAYTNAREAVRVYEETKKILDGAAVMTIGGEASNEAVALMYAIAAEAAAKAGDHNLALERHTIAYTLDPLNAKLAALHVVALIKADRKDAAQKFIDDAMKRNDSFSADLRKHLVQLGIIDR